MPAAVAWGIVTAVMPAVTAWVMLELFLRFGPLPGSGPAAARRLQRVAAPWRWAARSAGLAALGVQVGWLEWPWWLWPVAAALDIGAVEALWRQTLRKQFPHLG